ncbi:hypothetical protein AWC17_22285 [Mycobacterium nebraskense]|uniref:Uncharacterized protein n=2 Tax=Mycobacterium nebraskense TaxID=244292 RepID=A0A0F5N6K1_9MYCO|nr:hypothetical protein [Mycobacterium nebraskense]KKC02661.1 hypothetical protein WU83_23075 [Mycobacterium nebraskense]KLO44621.1 hypothetical protein ABW17_07910 [Mycobacterium nebraskense]MBI2695672.1 hypothetical protein [Mycobacterium nebraskense]MCV7120896.1 hypothetical protein [Mycobacterium nebraskense]ORW35129.1 hypothetical protein AWC17_22285 [Mycobacterium nebraskense]
MLGGLSVPLKWGVAVPPDDYDHWAPKPEVSADSADSGDAAADAPAPAVVADAKQFDEWNEWKRWDGETEPHFEMPRSGGVIPHSPAAG